VVGKEIGRPQSPGQGLAALGFLLAGVGLFTIPHHVGLPAMIREAATAGAEDHLRALTGLVLIVVGTVAALAGIFAGRGRGNR
jgi:hypothetical protein